MMNKHSFFGAKLTTESAITTTGKERESWPINWPRVDDLMSDYFNELCFKELPKKTGLIIHFAIQTIFTFQIFFLY